MDFLLVVLFYAFIFMLGGAFVYAVMVANKAYYFHSCGWGWCDAVKLGMREVDK